MKGLCISPISAWCCCSGKVRLAKQCDRQQVPGLHLGSWPTGKHAVQAKAAEAELQPLMSLMKEALGERVEKVVVSQRLADSPCALSVSKHGWSAYQERIMRSQVPHSLSFSSPVTVSGLVSCSQRLFD